MNALEEWEKHWWEMLSMGVSSIEALTLDFVGSDEIFT
jgi:hypothetical protein